MLVGIKMQRLKNSIVNKTSLVIMLAVIILAALLSWGQEIFYDLSMDNIEWEVVYDSSDKVEPDSTGLKSPWVKNAPGKCDIRVASDSLSKNKWGRCRKQQRDYFAKKHWGKGIV